MEVREFLQLKYQSAEESDDEFESLTLEDVGGSGVGAGPGASDDESSEEEDGFSGVDAGPGAGEESSDEEEGASGDVAGVAEVIDGDISDDEEDSPAGDRKTFRVLQPLYRSYKVCN